MDKRVRFTIAVFSICIHCDVKATFIDALKREGTKCFYHAICS